MDLRNMKKTDNQLSNNSKSNGARSASSNASRNGHNYPFEVKRSGIQGQGAFAIRRIRKGQRIIEYTGKRISQEEVDAMYDDSEMDRHHTFLFSVDENTTIDASREGNEARFINHSCDPNCEAVDEDGHIFIEAIKNIQPGVELTYDYNFELDEPYTKELRDFYVCHCGAKSCRGTILNISPSQRKKIEAAERKRRNGGRTRKTGNGSGRGQRRRQ